MSSTSIGRFWAIGVGPGDPELLTLRAVRVLRQADIIYHAGCGTDEGRALAIVRSLLRPDQETRRVLTEAMRTVSATDWRPHYRPGVEGIATDCRSGRNVVFVTEGDPALYSSAAHVWQLLAELHPEISREMVPGVSSITAAAARVGWPLVQKDEPLLIVPAGYHAARLRQWIAAFPTVCLLKPVQTMPQLVQALAAPGPQREAVYVEELGTEQEWITQDLAAAVERRNYFSLVLVRATAPIQSARLARSASEGSHQPGKVFVVGLGPGDPDLLTHQAVQILKDVDVIVGYDGYLQRLDVLGLRAERIAYPIGAEAERARQALELAQAGRRVALVSSGDAGVYGMASLLLETAAALPDVAVEVVPGVTAAVAASALLGAPLGHDFACISLSDLLTPWDVIERRLEAAARSDFVLALYNPISQRRTWQLPRAREILLRHRNADTPVGLVDKAHRPGMRIWHATLGALTIDGIGMETTLIIGNSQTRRVNDRLVTPRGYTVPQASGGRKPPEDGARVLAAPSGGLRSPLALVTGRRIMEESFARIERELGTHTFPPWAFAVVRRMIHASADFEFAQLLRYSADFEDAIREALQQRAPVVTDTEMVLLGIRTALADTPNVTLACHLNDPDTLPLSESAGITRSAAGIRLAARRYPAPVVVIGNAPTALDEALDRIADDWRPAAIIAMPVGFVGVVEAKGRLLEQSRVPYLTCSGRKGGSAVTAAAVNAMTEWMSTS